MKRNLADAYQLLHDGALDMAEMELAGMKVDIEYVDNTIAQLEKDVAELKEEFLSSPDGQKWYNHYGAKTNIDSPTQFATFLFDILGLSLPEGKRSTDKATLAKISDDVQSAKTVSEIRKLTKPLERLISIKNHTVKGYIYPSFMLNTVQTYRSSSANPNWQNNPSRDPFQKKTVRRALIPSSDSRFVEWDFKGMEVSVGCCYHKDPTMIKYLNDPSMDLHWDIIREIFILGDTDKTKGIRYLGKNGFVFPQFYGDYYKNCAVNIWEGADGVELPNGTLVKDHLAKKGFRTYAAFEAHVKLIEDYFWNDLFPVYNNWKNQQWSEYQKKLYFEFLTGFREYGVYSRNQCNNHPVQGTAFHVLLKTVHYMMRKMDENQLVSFLIAQIHDSVLGDILDNELKTMINIVRDIVKNRIPKEWEWINVPLVVEMEMSPVNGNWSQMEASDIII